MADDESSKGAPTGGVGDSSRRLFLGAVSGVFSLQWILRDSDTAGAVEDDQVAGFGESGFGELGFGGEQLSTTATPTSEPSPTETATTEPTETETATPVETPTPSPPRIDAYTVTEAASPNPHATITADWTGSDPDGDLSRVEISVRDAGSGRLLDSRSRPVSGTSASGSEVFKFKHARGRTFDVRLVVVDETGSETGATRTVSE